jgi:hypothetical protein
MATVSFKIQFGYSTNAGNLFVIITNCPFPLSSNQGASATMDYVYTTLSGLINAPFSINYENVYGASYDNYLYFGGMYSTTATIYKTIISTSGINSEYVAGTLTFITD